MINYYKVVHMSEFDILSDMLVEYISELHSIDSNVELRDKHQLAHEYFYACDTDFYLLDIDGVIVGFAVIGYNTNCHELIDSYIEEFYIKPEYRRKGYATAFVLSLIQNYESVCFFVLKANLAAKQFWRNIFTNWADVSNNICDTSNAPDWLDWYVYMRTK